MDCIFCSIIEGKIPSKKIFESDNFLSFFDANPVTPGHALVIPKRHYEIFLDMPSSLGIECLDIINKTTLRILKENNASGFKLVSNNKKIAGQVVPHLHFHIIPRKENDGIKHLV